jgi:(E)-4-hydroxy-3-methylbut-2-enyl-diphosphate synthase
MTTSDTLDVDATVRQCINLAEAGCEIVRITAPNRAAAAALREISRGFRAAGFGQPLVADIHFIPAAAMEAVEHVEKVRINPGNYADRKRFSAREYSDGEYDAELGRIHAAVSPLVLRARELGRVLRIGTNHGSLSDRIMNRYGDSPLGMVESALEFIRICESHGFHDIVLSMKASNPKVMIEAYRLAVARMDAEGMRYPLHLGVTEAGEGEDARIKSAIGIGALLQDGLGDTLRVSLTEDPWYEIPVAADLAARARELWARGAAAGAARGDGVLGGESFSLQYRRRDAALVAFGAGCAVGGGNPPRVVVPAGRALGDVEGIVRELREAHAGQKEVRAEGLLVGLADEGEILAVRTLGRGLGGVVRALFVEVDVARLCAGDFERVGFQWGNAAVRLVFVCRVHTEAALAGWLALAGKHDALLAVDFGGGAPVDAVVAALAPVLACADPARVICTLAVPDAAGGCHALGSHRVLVAALRRHGVAAPVWIRNTLANAVAAGAANDFPSRLIEASMLSGALFCEGIGDLISVETAPTPAKALVLAYDILQGARMRVSKTEYVACPSCGRTLFDIQATTLKIKARTGHLKGVTIAVMGCIVNGPGEMADADFGYVGGAPGKINLYVRRECVRFGIPQEEAVDRLVDLIREHGKWVDPDAT